jgi:hypothetical protein
MSIRTTCNQTIKTVKRSRVSTMTEIVAWTPTIITSENNSNLVTFDTVADDGTPISYRGYEHIPCGTSQYDANPIP